MAKLALVYNYAQHYRENIFSLMDADFDIEFYFGDRYLNVKKLDYSIFRHKVTEVRNLHFGPFFWQPGIAGLAFKKSYSGFIVLGEPYYLSTWLLLCFGRLTGKHVYFWSHGWYGRESWIKTIVKKLFFGLADGTFLYGNYAKNLMIQAGCNPKKLFVIGNSLDYDTQLAYRHGMQPSDLYTTHFGNENPVIVVIGRLNARKKLSLLLKAVARIQQHGCPCNLVIVGDGEDRPRLEELSRDLGLGSSVWFYGASYDELQNAELLYNADLCVIPGDIGLTAVHAMMFGCPCITHDCYKYQGPEFEAIQPGKTGDFYHYEDAADLEVKIRHWIDAHGEDRDVVRRYCYEEVDRNWNPHRQLEIMKMVLTQK